MERQELGRNRKHISALLEVKDIAEYEERLLQESDAKTALSTVDASGHGTETSWPHNRFRPPVSKSSRIVVVGWAVDFGFRSRQARLTHTASKGT